MNNETKMTLISVVIISMLAILAFVPAFAENEIEAEEEIIDPYVTYGLLDDIGDTWGKFVRQGQITVALPLFVLGTHMESYGSDVLFGGGGGAEAGAPESVKEYAREVESRATREKIDIVSQLAAGLIENDTQTWGLAESSLNRLAEIAAGSLWQSGETFSADDILFWAGIYEILANSNYNTQYSIDWAYDQAGNRVQYWPTTEWASSMSANIGWNGGSTADASQRLNINIATIVTSASGSNLVYLDTEFKVNNDLSNGLWSFQPSATLTYLDTGDVRSLSQGYNNVSGMQSGWYILSSGTFAGPFLQSTSTTAAKTEGGAVIMCDDSYGYITVNSDGSLKIRYGGSVYDSPYIAYGITADGVTEWSNDDSIVRLMRSYSAYYDQLSNALIKSANAALVMWQISAIAKQSNIFLSPSSILPMLEDISVDINQAYSLYISALNSISDFYRSYGEILKASQVKISAESLQLYCFGTIYNGDGTVLASNVAFTPYTYVHNMTISTARYNQFSESGAVMIWDRSATSATSWLGASDIADYAYVQMLAGSYFVAEEIVYKGVSVNDLTLRVKTIDQIDGFTDTFLGLEETPFVYDAVQLFILIIYLTCAVLFLISVVVHDHKDRIPAGKLISKIIVVVTIVVAILGLFWPGPEWMVNLLFGGFT